MQKHKFEIKVPSAKEVYLAGDFNDWNPSSIPLKKKRGKNSGSFSTELQVEPGLHEFKFIIDGEWKCDADTPTVPNPYGSHNSILEIPPPSKGH